MKKTRYASCAIAAVICLGLTSCITIPVTMTPSNTPLFDRTVSENHGLVRGTHTTGSILGLWMIKRPDIDTAIKRALEQKGGDALINVRCYEQVTWFLLFSLHKVIVEGEAVTFKKDEKGQKKKR
jgi:hypothetical protein